VAQYASGPYSRPEADPPAGTHATISGQEETLPDPDSLKGETPTKIINVFLQRVWTGQFRSKPLFPCAPRSIGHPSGVRGVWAVAVIAAAVALSQAGARRAATIPLALAGVIGAIDHAAPFWTSRDAAIYHRRLRAQSSAHGPRPTSDLRPHLISDRRDRYCTDAIHATTSSPRRA
jgi:hypothetical protein